MRRGLLYQYECGKLFGNQVNLILILLFLAIKIVLAAVTFASPGDDIYRDYMQQLEGGYTTEKEQKLLHEQQWCDQILQQQPQMQENYLKGDLSKEDYEEYQQQYLIARQKAEILPQVMERNDYLRARTEQKETLLKERDVAQGQEKSLINEQLKGYEQPAEFLYDTGWNRLTARGELDLPLDLLLMLLFIPYFVRDYESKTAALIDTSYNKNGSHMIRFVLMLVTSGMLVLLFGLIDLLFAGTLCGLPNGDAPIQSLAAFAGYPGTMSLHGLLWAGILLRLLGTLTLMMVLYWSVRLLKRSIPAAGIYLFVSVIPYLEQFFSGLLPEWVHRILFVEILNGFAVVSHATVIDGLDVPIQSVCLSTGWFVILFLMGIVLGLVAIQKQKR